MKKLYSLFVSILIALSIVFTGAHSVKANAVSIDDYYKTASLSSGQSLLYSLHDIIKNPKVVAYKALWSIYDETDVKVGKNGKLVYWDMYSNVEHEVGKYSGGNASEGAGMNKEHSIPQSWFGEASPMVSDAFHVYPTDCYVNNMRSSYPFGEVASPKKTSGNGSKLGTCTFPGYTGTAFEPIDEYKGDFARTYFYFATCYYDKNIRQTSNAQAVFTNSYPYLSNYAVQLFTKWHMEDPVSQKEIDRNEAVYNVQGNRNPFIDHPEWSTIIWGGTYGGGSVTSTYSVNYVVPEGATFTYTDTKRYESNETITMPTQTPNKLGYTFDGWYKDSNYSSKWNFTSDKITSNTTLYAKMSVNPEEVGEIFKRDTKMQVALGINYSILANEGPVTSTSIVSAQFGFDNNYSLSKIDANGSIDITEHIISKDNKCKPSDVFSVFYEDTGRALAYIKDGSARLYYNNGTGNKIVIKVKEGYKLKSISPAQTSSDAKWEVNDSGTEAYIQATKDTTSKYFTLQGFTVEYEEGASYDIEINKVELKARYLITQEIYDAIIKGQSNVRCYMTFNDSKVLCQLVKEGQVYSVMSSVNVNIEDFAKKFNICGTIVIGEKTYTTKTISYSVNDVASKLVIEYQSEIEDVSGLPDILREVVTSK